ncbi:hypothetical protein ACRAWD_10215 [Caulobacter segnis]
MTFSYNLVLALFLLAPGFAFVAGVYATGRSAIHEASPPPPNSIMALAMVTGASLVAHTAAAALPGVPCRQRLDTLVLAHA